jgi:transcriptional regulator CtsR
MFTALKAGAAAVVIAGATFAAPDVAQEARPENAPAHAQDQGRFQGPIMDTIIEFLDVSKGEVISNWATGNTLAELAEENGSSGTELLDALMAMADARIDEALANGRIDETEAEELRARAEDRLTPLVFDAHNRLGRPGLGGQVRAELTDVIENELDLNHGQIISHVRTGGTLAELAEENGSTGAELVDALLAVVEERVEATLAEGIISEERAAGILENAEARLNRLVFEVHEPGRGRSQ